MKILNLTLKKQWFDLIAAGTKKEEYRELKNYWDARFYNYPNRPTKATLKRFDVVRFKNGYAADAPEITVECKGIRIGEGKTEWGAVPGQQYFVIELGQILKPVNL